jgi:ABC-type phosphate transport system permease subunit
MKNTTAGALSGCLVWLLSIAVISSCILPIFFVAGSITSFSQYAITFTGKFLCPTGTTPQGYTYATTTRDEYGNVHPATGMELHCVDQNGALIKNDPVVYAFAWIGIFAVIGLLISAILAFVFATPAGILITRLLNRRRKPDISANIES